MAGSIPSDPSGPRRRPSVLVITPTLGHRPETLAEAAASLLRQSVSVRHVIVAPVGVDAASIRGAELVKDPGRGLSAAFNAGLARVGDEEFVYWLNDDDRALPGGLDELARCLSLDPSAVAAIGAIDLVDGDGRRMMRLGGGALTVRLLAWGPGMMASPGVLYRTVGVRRAGGLDERLLHAGDLDLLLRLATGGPIVSTRRAVGEFRWHGGSLTVGDPERSLAEAERVRAAHHRRRSRLAMLAYAAWRPLAGLATRVAKGVVTARSAGARVDD